MPKKRQPRSVANALAPLSSQPNAASAAATGKPLSPRPVQQQAGKENDLQSTLVPSTSARLPGTHLGPQLSGPANSLSAPGAAVVTVGASTYARPNVSGQNAAGQPNTAVTLCQMLSKASLSPRAPTPATASAADLTDHQNALKMQPKGTHTRNRVPAAGRGKLSPQATIHALVTSSGLPGDDPELQQYVRDLFGLADAMQGEDMSAADLLEPNAVPYLLSLLQSSDPDTKDNIAGLLCLMCMWPQGRQALGAAGGIAAFMSVLQHSKSGTLQGPAAFALSMLASDGVVTRQTLADTDAIPFLTALLSNTAPRIQADAATALGLLADVVRQREQKSDIEPILKQLIPKGHENVKKPAADALMQIRHGLTVQEHRAWTAQKK